jgi:type IV secretory pathway VirB10-like protein
MSTTNDRVAKAASVLNDKGSDRSDDAPKKYPLFIILVATLVVIIAVAVTLSMSGGTSATPQQQQQQQADSQSSKTQDMTYGAGTSTGNYAGTGGGNAGNTTGAVTGNGCRVGFARATNGQCVQLAAGEGQSGGQQTNYAQVQDANAKYADEANAAMTHNSQTSYSTDSTSTVPAITGPQPKTIVVGNSAGGTTASSQTSGTDPTAAALAQMRQQIQSQIQSQISQGGYGTNNGTYGQPQTQSSPQATATPDRTGVLGTKILPAPAYAIPMGTCLDATTIPTLDSSLAGPFYVSIDRDYTDPRNGALVIPATTIVMGHYVGLTDNATHMGVSWDWDEYPDLEKRALSAEVTASAATGENGIPGRINTHLYEQFRNQFFSQIVNAAGQVMVNLTSRATDQTQVTAGNTNYSLTPNGANIEPTLYLGRAQHICLLLAVDYDAEHPYTGRASR